MVKFLVIIKFCESFTCKLLLHGNLRDITIRLGLYFCFHLRSHKNIGTLVVFFPKNWGYNGIVTEVVKYKLMSSNEWLYYLYLNTL